MKSNQSRLERLKSAQSSAAQESNKIELIDRYKGGVATELYKIYLVHKDELNIGSLQQMRTDLGGIVSFDTTKNFHRLLCESLEKGKEMVESFRQEHASMETNLEAITLDLLKTELNLRFDEKQQETEPQQKRLRISQGPSSSPKPSRELNDSPLRQQEQLREFLELSPEDFDRIPVDIRNKITESTIPKLESIYATDPKSHKLKFSATGRGSGDMVV